MKKWQFEKQLIDEWSNYLTKHKLYTKDYSFEKFLIGKLFENLKPKKSDNYR